MPGFHCALTWAHSVWKTEDGGVEPLVFNGMKCMSYGFVAKRNARGERGKLMPGIAMSESPLQAALNVYRRSGPPWPNGVLHCAAAGNAHGMGGAGCTRGRFPPWYRWARAFPCHCGAFVTL